MKTWYRWFCADPEGLCFIHAVGMGWLAGVVVGIPILILALVLT